MGRKFLEEEPESKLDSKLQCIKDVMAKHFLTYRGYNILERIHQDYDQSAILWI